MQMSDAPVTSTAISMYDCTWCGKQPDPSSLPAFCHVTPCGHVVCSTCIGGIGDPASSRKDVCRLAGCGAELAPSDSFVPAWCTRRPARLAVQLVHVFADQGDAGEDDPKAAGPGSRPYWSMCPTHGKQLERVGSADKGAPLFCADCPASPDARPLVEGVDSLIATYADAAAGESKSGESKGTDTQSALFYLKTLDKLQAEPLMALVARLSDWATTQTARIQLWEDREVKSVHAAAAEAVAVVAAVRASRTASAESALRQWVSLRLSLEEVATELADEPADRVERASKLVRLQRDRAALLRAMNSGQLRVAGMVSVAASLKLPPRLGTLVDVQSTVGTESLAFEAGLKRLRQLVKRQPHPGVRVARAADVDGEIGTLPASMVRVSAHV